MPDQDEDLFEFAVSCGEGTLIDFGVADFGAVLPFENDEYANDPRLTIIAAAAATDCATGK